MRIHSSSRACSRTGVAAAEFAVCLPFMFLTLAGVWEVGRITEIQTVAMNAAREAARDASLCQDDLDDVTANTIVYLQAAEPLAFGSGHATTTTTATGLTPSATAGRKVVDNTTGNELFTITYYDQTQPALSPMDPTNAAKLDVYDLGIQIPYRTVSMSPLPQITGTSRLTTKVTWLCMRDTPFGVSTVLPAQ